MSQRIFRVRCRRCLKWTRGRLPKMGDGTFYYPAKHSDGGKVCEGSFEEGEPGTFDQQGRRVDLEEG